jgi:RNA 2',3'-cyclic 3'-phosphodiesterase
MTSAASVEGRERLRLFVALLLPEDALSQLVAWQERELPRTQKLRIVPRGNLHVTLAFLGGRPAGELPGIVETVRGAASGAERPVLVPARFRETRSVGMIAFTDEEGHATRLAQRVFTGLERLGVYERERREWLPHVTVVRFRDRPRLTPDLPALGEVVSSEMAVMMSRLRPTGAQYEVLESVSLGG